MEGANNLKCNESVPEDASFGIASVSRKVARCAAFISVGEIVAVGIGANAGSCTPITAMIQAFRTIQVVSNAPIAISTVAALTIIQIRSGLGLTDTIVLKVARAGIVGQITRPIDSLLTLYVMKEQGIQR